MLSSPGNSTAEAALGLLVERDRLLLLLFSALLGLWLMSSMALHGNTILHSGTHADVSNSGCKTGNSILHTGIKTLEV